MNLWLLGRRTGGRDSWEFGINTYILLYLKWLTKDLLHSTENSAQCNVAAWMGEEFGREWIHVYIAESLCCPPETHSVNQLYCNIKLKLQKQKKKDGCGLDPLNEKHFVVIILVKLWARIGQSDMCKFSYLE